MKILNLEISTDIHTREEIRKLFNFDKNESMKNWQQAEQIVINMSKCFFISRSPAHELVKQTEKLEKNYNMKIILKNLQYETDKMIKVVKQSIKQVIDTNKSYKAIKYSDNNEFYNLIEKW